MYTVGKFKPIAVVKVLQHRYLFDNPIDGIDCCFKALWALNCSYTPKCAHIWLFLQKSIYNISYSNEKVPSGVLTLLNELQNVSLYALCVFFWWTNIVHKKCHQISRSSSFRMPYSKLQKVLFVAKIISHWSQKYIPFIKLWIINPTQNLFGKLRCEKFN